MMSTWILMLIVVDAAVPRLHAATAGKPVPRQSPRIHVMLRNVYYYCLLVDPRIFR